MLRKEAQPLLFLLLMLAPKEDDDRNYEEQHSYRENDKKEAEECHDDRSPSKCIRRFRAGNCSCKLISESVSHIAAYSVSVMQRFDLTDLCLL